MRTMVRHPVYALVTRLPATYGRNGVGFNPREVGGPLADWWAIPCNKTMVLAGVAAAAASALATAMLRKNKKKPGDRRAA
jgi:hypothetical protein